MATNNSPANRRDPLPVFCFKVQLKLGGQSAEAFFKSVSGLKYETEAVDLRAGGVNHTTFKLVGSTKWPNIVLKRGFTGSSELLTWREDWLKVDGKRTRAEGTIIQLDTELNPRAQWKFIEGWPVKWEVSELDASKSELAIETLEIAHHGLVFGQ
jgi:phage tail-like protein